MIDPLRLQATPVRVRAAAAAANLSAAALDRALSITTATPSASEWRRFLARALSLLGAALVLAGVVCFFAYNWERLGRFGKLGLIEVGIVVAALVALWRLPRLSGQIALASAAVLVGPLLGVYGQTYQTGADPYGLFLTWALLIVPWTIAARFSALWVVQVVLFDVALTLFWSQAVSTPGADGWTGTFVIVGAVHALALLAWEWQYRRPAPWLNERWAPHEIALAGFAALVVAGGAFIIEPGNGGRVHLSAAAGLAMLVAAVATALWYFQQVRPDRFMVTTAGASALALAAVLVGRVVIADLDMGALGFLLVGLFVVGEIAFGLRWLQEHQPTEE